MRSGRSSIVTMDESTDNKTLNDVGTWFVTIHEEPRMEGDRSSWVWIWHWYVTGPKNDGISRSRYDGHSHSLEQAREDALQAIQFAGKARHRETYNITSEVPDGGRVEPRR